MFPGWRIERLFQMVDAAPGAARAQEPGLPATRIQLEDFLGADVLTSGIVLVYPTIDLPTHLVPDLRAAAVPDRCPVGSKVRALAAAHRPDQLVALPEKEFRGLLYVFSMLQGHADIVADIRSDREVAANSDCPYISFGLTANDCTRMYLESVDHPLFTLSGGAEGDSHFDQLELIDGTRYGCGGDRNNLGVIVRVRPSPELHPDRYWIFCAGLGPRGTTGASWYLANSWGRLQRRAGDRDFVAVVGVGNSSDGTAHLGHFMIGSS